MLGERFRIVALLGHGGMGEVYRAEDLRLGQTVALKLLPEAVENDPTRLQRLLGEVRLALRVTHPHVCRVHDVGQVNERHYVSMEYVDGGDLASLLRRVGRLPEDRAVEVARQLCAGLAAIHEQGILHRDLKPANVLLDGHGRVKITDFGLAALDDDGQAVHGGTPAYMAPEQWAGHTTVQSDLYALGLVLYEMFTGRPVFAGTATSEWARIHRESAPTSPTSHVETLDPAVERAVLKCLEKDPAERPRSALAVAAALPGGDPLAAALAAGETPSPELVARAPVEGRLRPRVAAAIVAATAACFAVLAILQGDAHLTRLVPLPKSPEVLAERAQEILHQLGYGPGADYLQSFEVRADAVRHVLAQSPHRDLPNALRRAEPAVLEFCYRTSPKPLVKVSTGSLGDWMHDPPFDQPGMCQIALDPRGRLLRFAAIPSDLDSTAAAVPDPDWAAVFATAGLDVARFERTDPAWTPPFYADARHAWRGALPESPATPVRVEAASFRGHPVAFGIILPWTNPRSQAESRLHVRERLSSMLSAWLFLLAIAVAAFVAWRNLHTGRGDRRGALRLALYLGGMRFLWFLGAHHVLASGETDLLVGHLAWSCYRVCVVWIFYLAFEPYARRLWPSMMVSWVRLLGGRWRDALVGRDVLIGFALGIAAALALQTAPWLAIRLGLESPMPDTDIWTLEPLLGPRHALVSMAALHTQSVLGVFTLVTILLVLRILLRRTWLAASIVSIMVLFIVHLDGGNRALSIAGITAMLLLLWLSLFRFGFLCLVATFSTMMNVGSIPLFVHAAPWYLGVTVLQLAVAAAIGGLALRATLGAGTGAVRARVS
jgi:serine/threonine-protein kinase